MTNTTEYEKGLNEIVERNPLVKADRTTQLVAYTAMALNHFFETGEYGDPEQCNPGTLPAIWPYVRYSVFDLLRPQFNLGDPKFASINWQNDKMLTDIQREALAIHGLLPEDLQHPEWLFMVSVAAHMLMEDPFLIEGGYINEEGRRRVISQSLMTIGADGDMYEEQFEKWAETYTPTENL